MAARIIQSSDGPNSSVNGIPSLVDPPENVPAWFSARRERQPPAGNDGVKELADPKEAVDPFVAIAAAAERAKSKGSPSPTKPEKQEQKIPSTVPFPPTEGLQVWLSRQGLIGIATSLAVHAVILLILACFLVSQVTTREVSSLWGTNGDNEEFAADLIMDTELSGDSLDSGESAPLQMSDLTQAMDSLGPQGEISESMRVGLGGKGNGEGDSGDGASMGVANLKVPGHAQTKGSFSAWADPRDPQPGQDYFVVIQIRLPKTVTKYRGSDVSGNVIGTDGYKQPIRFKGNVDFPVADGAVEIRVPVPGTREFVRDVIRVESKLLKEKQTFEIEF